MASASDTTISSCPVCLQDFLDARVLPCLHSVCKACVDKMIVSDGGPICRTVTLLTSGGADELPKDVTVLATSGGSESLECGLCDDETTGKEPLTWCKTCRLPLCDGHAVPHMVSANSDGELHLVVPLSFSMKASAGETTQSQATEVDAGFTKCPRHGEQMKFHCGSCDIAVCGDCVAVGYHQGHTPVCYIKDMVEERRQQVARNVDRLEAEFTEKVERSLQVVDQVSTELVRRAKSVRSDIEQAGQEAVQMVEAHVKQMTQEVDDLEESRLKVLDQLRDELTSLLDSTKNAVRFKERLMQLSTRNGNLFPLVKALDTRTDSILSTHVHEEPQHHSRVMFLTASGTDLACKTKEAIGKVTPCHASTQHTLFKGRPSQIAEKGKTLTIIVKATDHHGQRVSTADDVISTRCTATCETEHAPSTTITNNGDGTHTISVTSPSAGSFQVEVFVNGEKTATDFHMTFCDSLSALLQCFDQNECHSSITISENGRKASNTQWPGYNSVFGTAPMKQGQFSWKLKTTGYHCLGISTNPSRPLSHFGDHETTANCWSMNSHFFDGAHYRDGVKCSQEKMGAANDDTLQLDLDCSQHTLQITNLRSGKTSTFSELPDKEYFQYAAFYGRSSAEFVD